MLTHMAWVQLGLCMSDGAHAASTRHAAAQADWAGSSSGPRSMVSSSRTMSEKVGRAAGSELRQRRPRACRSSSATEARIGCTGKHSHCSQAGIAPRQAAMAQLELAAKAMKFPCTSWRHGKPRVDVAAEGQYSPQTQMTMYRSEQQSPMLDPYAQQHRLGPQASPHTSQGLSLGSGGTCPQRPQPEVCGGRSGLPRRAAPSTSPTAAQRMTCKRGESEKTL